MVSLQKIATICGVSVGTVSKALRDKPGVRADVRARIISVARQHNYRPNRLVHAIQSGRSMTIGVLCSHFGEEFSGTILDNIVEVLERESYDILVTNWDRNVEQSNRVLQRYFERRIDGILMFPPAVPPSQSYLNELQSFQQPIVVVDQTWPGCHYDTVGSRDEDGAYRLTNHLIEIGHRRIANIHFSLSSTGRKRLEGFHRAMIHHGVSVHEQWLREIHDYESRQAYAYATELLSAANRPSAIVTFNDKVAIQVMAAAADLGLSIPDDVSVTGFADLSLARELRPRLTTVAQNPALIGQRAAQQLLDRIQAKGDDEASRFEPINEQVDVSLQIRDTTAAPPA